MVSIYSFSNSEAHVRGSRDWTSHPWDHGLFRVIFDRRGYHDGTQGTENNEKALVELHFRRFKTVNTVVRVFDLTLEL